MATLPENMMDLMAIAKTLEGPQAQELLVHTLVLYMVTHDSPLDKTLDLFQHSYKAMVASKNKVDEAQLKSGSTET